MFNKLVPYQSKQHLVETQITQSVQKGIVPVPICHMPISIKTAKAIEQKVEHRGWKTNDTDPTAGGTSARRLVAHHFLVEKMMLHMETVSFC